MCIHAHTLTGYVHMYACTCVLTTPHKSQTKENHHTKKMQEESIANKANKTLLSHRGTPNSLLDQKM